MHPVIFDILEDGTCGGFCHSLKVSHPAEMVIDFCHGIPPHPLSVNSETKEMTQSSKYLCTLIDYKLTFHLQREHFL